MESEKNMFVIHRRLPSLNDYTNANRSHWSKGARLKKETEQDIAWEIVAALRTGTLHPVTELAFITFEWHESDDRRDLDNIFSAKKFILDAMQQMRIIVNDNRKYICGMKDLIVDDSSDFVRVYIETL